MRSYKEISIKKLYKLRTIIRLADETKDLPFLSVEDVPNNWLRLHGYAMKKRKTKELQV